MKALPGQIGPDALRIFAGQPPLGRQLDLQREVQLAEAGPQRFGQHIETLALTQIDIGIGAAQAFVDVGEHAIFGFLGGTSIPARPPGRQPAPRIALAARSPACQALAMNSDRTLTVALAQIAPVWLDREATLARVVDSIARAAEENARLVAFGEGLVPGYPFWVEHTDGARFESEFQKSMFAHYVEQAVDIERGDLAAVSDAARRGRTWVALGTIERPADRGSHSLYCSLVLIDDSGAVRNVHRKLMPTHEERMVWSPGDGHGLRVFDIDGFTVGGLNCWENWMPLARSALYAQGMNVHVAVWPGNLRNTRELTRHIARESRGYALSVSGLFGRSDVPEHVPHAETLRNALPDTCADGGSCLAGPDGEWLIEPQVGSAGLWLAELSLTKIRAERQNFDPFGHYSRPDVLELRVDRSRRRGVRFEDGN